MKQVNRQGLPLPIEEAFKNRPYDKGDSWMSVTSLIQPPRIHQMVERMGDSLEVDIADSLPALDGSAMHAVLEWAAKGLDPDIWIVEKRWFAEVLGKKISGQGDVANKPEQLLTDYKRCSRWVGVFGAKDEWEQQLNMLRWLAHMNGVEVNKLQVFAWFKDWSKTESIKNKGKGYPQKDWELINIPVWDMDRAKAFTEERVRLHLEAEGMSTENLPLCTEEERWQKGDGYAVMLHGEKRARHLASNKQDALHYIATELRPEQVAIAKVESRVSDPRRCTSWCPVRFHCAYGRKWAQK